MIQLPYPPSANRLWRNVKGRMVKSAEYRTWLSAAVASCRGAVNVPGPYHLTITATRPDRRRRDIDNLIKPVSDALCAAGVVDDDSAALSVYAAWRDDAPVKHGALLVSVRAPE